MLNENYVCNDEYCKDFSISNCKKINSCGHTCQGQNINDHGQCPGCIHENCTQTYNRQDKCFCGENFHEQPVVQLKCKHLMHYDCLKRKLEIGYSGPRIYFSFLNCVCGYQVQKEDFSTDLVLSKLLTNWQNYKDIIVENGLQRLIIENLENSPELFDKSKKW